MRRRFTNPGIVRPARCTRVSVAFLHRSIFPWGHPYVVPSDALGHQVAKLLIQPSAARDRLTAECYLPLTESEPVGAIELALAATLEAEAIEDSMNRR